MLTKTDCSNMSLVLSDVDTSDQVDCKVNDILPVVLSFLIGFPDATGTVDYQSNVYVTTCNMCY